MLINAGPRKIRYGTADGWNGCLVILKDGAKSWPTELFARGMREEHTETISEDRDDYFTR